MLDGRTLPLAQPTQKLNCKRRRQVQSDVPNTGIFRGRLAERAQWRVFLRSESKN